jgi:hypothetical protein
MTSAAPVLEKGVHIRYIKELLGHFNIKTTERYLHVRREQLVNLVSPLDDIWKQGNLECYIHCCNQQSNKANKTQLVVKGLKFDQTLYRAIHTLPASLK